ncbi:MAG: phosphodiester glycosidase family protein [Firmicutes bacterium]|nr:phosphodiester glycosidase family protein [Bacillota bacterium]
MKKNKTRKIKPLLKILIGIDVLVAICFFLTYGPINYFRDFLITTAMTTKSHKYLARIFYSENIINEVLSNNYVAGFNEDTDASKVTVGKETTNYSSVYEKQILERDKDELYKLIEFKYNGYDVYLTAIYDPSRVKLATTRYIGYRGEYLVDMAKNYNAKVAINAGGFVDPGGEGNGGTPLGTVIEDGKIIWDSGNAVGGIAGFNKDNVLVLMNGTAKQAIDQGIRDAVQFGPFLIVNGKSANISGNGGWGINPRTVLAQRKDGIVLFLVIDGNGQNKYNWSGRGGVDMNGLIEILERYNAYNAVNMDGGASTTLVVEQKLYNKPCGYGLTGERALPNGWIVK